MDERIKRIALRAGGIASNNAGGFVFSIKNAAGNSAVDQGFDNLLSMIGIPVGTTQKVVKTLAYDLLALGAYEITENKSEAVKIAGNYGGQFFAGLGTSTVAADPTYVSPNAGGFSPAITTVPPVATLGPVPSGVLF